MEWPTLDPSIEIYPIPMFPSLEVSDLEQSVTWYTDVLGFQHIATLPDPSGNPGIAHLRWTKYADINLVPGDPSSSERRGRGVTLYFAMSENRVDALAERARAAAATILDGPVDQPWNARTVTITDPDGYRLMFGFAPLKEMTWEEVGRQVHGKSGK